MYTVLCVRDYMGEFTTYVVAYNVRKMFVPQKIDPTYSTSTRTIIANFVMI